MSGEAVLQVIYRDPRDLTPYKGNARTHSPEQIAQIAASIREFGFASPILLKDDETQIGAGHARREAALLLGLTSVPTITLHGLSESKWRAFVLADNKLALNAGWDEDVLRAEIEALGAEDFDLGLLGFDDDELDAMLNPPNAGHGDPDADAPEPPTEPVTRQGDVWLMGNHRVMCGDSTSAEAVAALMAGRLAELCFTSPPYGQQRDYGAAKEQVGDWDRLMEGVYSVLPMKPSGQVLVNLGLIHRDGEWIPYWDRWIEFMRGQGWRRFGWYVWDQGFGLPGDWNGRLAPSHEFVFHFNREPVRARKTKAKQADSIGHLNRSHTMRGKDGKVREFSSPHAGANTHKVPDSVIRVMRHQGSLGDAGSHPAVFSVGFAEEIITAFSTPRGVCFEPFCGSGSQVLAAERSDRICCGMELDPAYVDVAVRRWEAFTDRAAVLESTGQSFAEVRLERGRQAA